MMTPTASTSLPSQSSEPLIGLAYLLRAAYSGIDLGPLGAQLIERSQSHPDDANALMDLSTVLQLRGNPEVAMAVQAQALEIQQLYHLPTAQTARTIKLTVLAIMAPGNLMANTPLEFLLENSDIALDILYIAPGQPFPSSLPKHDVLFIAVGESDQNRPLLKNLAHHTQSWPCPVLNKPEHALYLSRTAAALLLKGAPGIAMPTTVRIDRQKLNTIGLEKHPITAFLDDGDFPIIVRPVDSHAGQGLMKLMHPEDIASYLQATPGNAFFISRFIDYRNTDNLFRKYRIVLIEGRPFVCHMALSEHWMIHYLNAGMSDSVEKRAEEAHCMKNFDEDFAHRHQEAFRSIHQRFALDYLGIDCGETSDGQLLIFEVDTGMIVHAMDPVDLFPYKQPQMQKVFKAFQGMLTHAVERHYTKLPAM